MGKGPRVLVMERGRGKWMRRSRLQRGIWRNSVCRRIQCGGVVRQLSVLPPGMRDPRAVLEVVVAVVNSAA